jgi:uncharacterized protein YjdB
MMSKMNGPSGGQMIRKKILACFAFVMLLMFLAPTISLGASDLHSTSQQNSNPVRLDSLNSPQSGIAVSITGSNTAQVGQTYTYTITVSGYASSIGGNITCGGAFGGSSATFWADSQSGRSEQISASATMTVTTSGSVGSVGTITVSGQYSTFDGTNVNTAFINETKNVNVQPSVTYQSHVQNVGWQGWVRDGSASGTSGQSLRLEAMRMKLEGVSGSIQYKTHVQNIGWMDWVSNGALSGTEGRSFRLEAIQIRLSGDAASQYDIYYRVHAQNFGWMGWAKNGASSGTAGFSYRLEAIQIVLVPKGGAAPGSTANSFVECPTVVYQSHVQNIGWQGWMANGQSSGTSGQSLRLEAMRMQLSNIDGGIEYKTHVQNIGWMDWVSNGALSGTEGRSYRLEAIQIRLTGAAASHYDVYYRVHAQNFGWMGWAKNGTSSGTAGFSYRLEAIQIVLVPKGTSPPGSTANSFVQR